MPITVHHMQVSQSERIPWLCEELGIPYNLVLHYRDPMFSPQSIKDLNPVGQAPVIQDGSLTLAESGACVEYIIHVHGNGRLALPPTHKNYADYLYWFHFANGTLQPNMLRMMALPKDIKPGSFDAMTKDRFENLLRIMNDRVEKNTWLAGEEFTAADIMPVFTLTTMRAFYPLDLSAHPELLKYLGRVAEREGYKKARAKADPELELMIDGKPPRSFRDILKAKGKI